MERLLLRVSETAKIIGLGKSKTYELIAKGELPSVRIGKCVRVPVAGLQEWVNARLPTKVREGEEAK
jgi:excisionase family DNA binding protein